MTTESKQTTDLLIPIIVAVSGLLFALLFASQAHDACNETNANIERCHSLLPIFDLMPMVIPIVGFMGAFKISNGRFIWE